MAVIKYKDKEGNYHKVSIGGGSGTDEVYIGSDTPPKGTKVWIDPTGTPSSPSQPSADNGIRYYVLPEGVAEGLHQPINQTYSFSSEEAEEFKRVIADWNNHTYIFLIPTNVGGYKYVGIIPQVGMIADNAIDCYIGGTPMEEYMNTDAFIIEKDDEGNVRV